MDLSVGEMEFKFCGKHHLLMARSQVKDPMPNGPSCLLICHAVPNKTPFLRARVLS